VKVYKIVIILVLLSVSLVRAGHAELYKRWMTKGMANGYFITEINDVDKINYYLQGAVDSLKAFSPGTISKHYSGFSLGDYYNIITDYYSKRPKALKKTVLQVLLEGCKK
jgi:hypothetical protein